MIAATSKIGAFAPYASATSQVVSSHLRPVVAAVVEGQKMKLPARPQPLTNQALSSLTPKSNSIRVTSGVNGAGSVRFAHTDLRVPDFSDYRKEETMRPDQTMRDTSTEKNTFAYVVAGVGGLAAVYSAKAIVVDFVSTMNASADVLALASIEINLDDIPEGKNLTLKWRGKPLFVRHRSAAEIEDVENVDVSSLRHQEHDKDRVQRPEWLVVLGICTHLGCVPIANAGDYNGYYCPCHGSHYDVSGRIRRGPAPLNLEVPEYTFPSDNILRVG